MKNIFLCLLCLLCCACNGPRQERKNISEVRLEGIRLYADSLYMGRYFKLLVGNEMIMPSYLKDTLMYVGKIKGDSLITQPAFLPSGIGPYEISHYHVVSTEYADSLFTFLDYNGGRLNFVYQIPIASDKRNSPHLWKKYSFDTITNYRCASPAIIQLSDSVMLLSAAPRNSPYVLSKVNLKTQAVEPIAFWPDKDGVDCPDGVRQAIYMDNSRLYKSCDKILYQCGDGFYAFIFELDGEKMINRKILFEEYPEYKTASDDLNYDYISSHRKRLKAFTTNRFIYIRLIEYESRKSTYKGYPYDYSDEIHVFNWEGERIKKYTLDIPFNFFIVDENDEYLYTKTLNLDTDEDEMRKYKL